MKKVIGFLMISLLSYSPLMADEYHEHNIKGNLELGVEVSHIKYEEPGIMEEDGFFYGIVGAYTFHPEAGSTSQAPFFKIAGKLAYGEVDYDSNGTGSIDGIDNYLFESRFVGGVDFVTDEKLRLSPYAGLGYRFLRDELGGRTSTTGQRGYDRTSQYLYIPLGAEVEQVLDQGWRIGGNLEYHLFLTGNQDSELSQVSSSFTDADNTQDEGYGFRGSVHVAKEGEDVDWIVEPYVRYWHIEDSNPGVVYVSNTPVLVFEPENKSTEIGVQFALQF